VSSAVLQSVLIPVSALTAPDTRISLLLFMLHATVPVLGFKHPAAACVFCSCIVRAVYRLPHLPFVLPAPVTQGQLKQDYQLLVYSLMAGDSRYGGSAV
jgi:hypothetical protein